MLRAVENYRQAAGWASGRNVHRFSRWRFNELYLNLIVFDEAL
jgi:hypothetical protein